MVDGNDVAGWWPGHPQPLTPEQMLAPEPGPGGAPAPPRAAGGVRCPRQRARDGGRRRLAALVGLAVQRRHHLPGPRDRCARRPVDTCRALWLPGSAAASAPVSCGSSCRVRGLPSRRTRSRPAPRVGPARGSPRLPRVRLRRAAGAAVRGGAARAVPRDARRLVPDRGGRPARDRTPPARARIAEQVPAGRLLDVGCGPGLLLDEARTAGYDVVGVELSREAAQHARDALGLDVREVRAGGLRRRRRIRRGRPRGRHRARGRPGRRHRALRGPVAPGGVVCVVTPDPSSATARLAGRRWWG